MSLTHLPAAVYGPVAAVRPADGVALIVLLAFTWWGARKGALRQALSLALLGGGFWAAGAFGPHLEPTLAKLFDLLAEERQALAWGAVLFGVLVVGAILLSLLGARLPERSTGGADRVFGGLFGAAKGAVVLTVVGYALLAFGSMPGGAALSRPAGAEAAPAPRDLTVRVRGSLSAVCLAEWSGLLRRWLDIPSWIEGRVDAVNRQIEGGATEDVPVRRPRAD